MCQSQPMKVSEAIRTRRSVRGFLDRPVDTDLVRGLLAIAARAPSGGNLQPWHIHVVTGDKLHDLKRIMAARAAELPAGEDLEYDIYPKTLTAPYLTRRAEIGEAMYATLGIPRTDRAARRAWFARNFQFFGAPLAVFCCIDRTHGPPQWSDAGMFLQTLMLLLREAGLDSCPQECWAMYPRTVGAHLGLAASQILFTGMAIGWADPDAVVNTLVSPRAELTEFATFHS
jgi:nitroreductase